MLGIDVSKRTLHGTLVDPSTQKVCWSMEVTNDPTGIARLLRRTPATVTWVLEPTGRYHELLVHLAHAQGRDVRMAQPKRAKYYLNSLQDRAKHDHVDSYGLARYGLAQSLPAFPVKRAKLDQLEQLQAARRGVVQTLMQLQQQAQDLPLATAELTPAISALQERQRALERAIEALLQQVAGAERIQRLRAVHGIGPITSTALLTCLLTRPFLCADAFVAFTGLDPKVREAGTQKGQSRLSKQGPGELRRLLYLAARSNLTIKDSPYRAQYERELAKGLCPQAALCAVARKLARTCWSLLAHASDYDPQRVHQASVRGSSKTPESK
jgi:transposase